MVVDRTSYLVKMVHAVFLTFLVLSSVQAATTNPLPSWNAGPNKQAIIDFVQAVTDKNSKDYVPPELRIASFDMDGTILIEQPRPVIREFNLSYLKKLAQDNPNLKVQPFEAVRKGDLDFLDKNLVLEAIEAGKGLSTTQYCQQVHAFGKTVKHPKFNRAYGELFYEPMLELISYLRENGFRVLIVSGSEQFFVRCMVNPATAIPMTELHGLKRELLFSDNDFLMGTQFLNDATVGIGKPITIHYATGAKPIFAFGNTSGDNEMLAYALSNKNHRSMAMWLDHDDGAREYVYAGGVADITHLRKVSMKHDFAKIFKDETQSK